MFGFELFVVLLCFVGLHCCFDLCVLCCVWCATRICFVVGVCVVCVCGWFGGLVLLLRAGFVCRLFCWVDF